jgi:hypothetical protein
MSRIRSHTSVNHHPAQHIRAGEGAGKTFLYTLKAGHRGVGLTHAARKDANRRGLLA